MVTNLPANAKHKWAEVVAARRPEDKIRLMREFLAICPKHKGTAKLIAHVKRRIVALEEEIEARRRARKTARDLFAVEKAGDVQIAVAGLTNVGKSSLLSALTNAKPDVSDVPYTTRLPIPGMLHYGGVDFQLVELPAIMKGSSEGKGNGLKIMNVIRTADGLILMVDLSKDPVEQWRVLTNELENVRVMVRRPKGYVEVERRHSGFISIGGGGRLVDCSEDDVRKLLLEYGLRSVFVKIVGEVTLDDVEDAIFGVSAYKPTVLLANKIDVPGAWRKLDALLKAVGNDVKVLPVSCRTGEGLENLGEELMRLLGLIRVYTKPPGRVKPDPKPVVLRRGATVGDVAKLIHRELYERFRYARVWGGRLKGVKVGLNYRVEDGYVVEIHSR
ncbi:TGS domain-containing protein [Candidatus Bathyarchaeota archaeon]|nr:TGS domain-containing protein [Candidatus Bathyarchaeota archaeon]